MGGNAVTRPVMHGRIFYIHQMTSRKCKRQSNARGSCNAETRYFSRMIARSVELCFHMHARDGQSKGCPNRGCIWSSVGLAPRHAEPCRLFSWQTDYCCRNLNQRHATVPPVTQPTTLSDYSYTPSCRERLTTSPAHPLASVHHSPPRARDSKA